MKGECALSSPFLLRHLVVGRRHRPRAAAVPLVRRQFRRRCRPLLLLLLLITILAAVGQLVLGELLLADILGRRSVARASE